MVKRVRKNDVEEEREDDAEEEEESLPVRVLRREEVKHEQKEKIQIASKDDLSIWESPTEKEDEDEDLWEEVGEEIEEDYKEICDRYNKEFKDKRKAMIEEFVMICYDNYIDFIGVRVGQDPAIYKIGSNFIFNILCRYVDYVSNKFAFTVFRNKGTSFREFHKPNAINMILINYKSLSLYSETYNNETKDYISEDMFRLKPSRIKEISQNFNQKDRDENESAMHKLCINILNLLAEVSYNYAKEMVLSGYNEEINHLQDFFSDEKYGEILEELDDREIKIWDSFLREKTHG